MKRILKITGVITLSPFVLFGIFMLFITIAEFRPESVSDSILVYKGKTENVNPKSLSLITWNIGYAGLDKYTDFVLDGGRMGKPRSHKAVETALAGISEFLKSNDADAYLLQEVDRNSSRSYRIDEAVFLASCFNSFSSYYSPNFRAMIVPFPLNDPIKKVESGIVTINRFELNSAIRRQLPGYYSWPVRAVHLKRCIMENRFKSSVAGKDWIVINLHLTAYGSGGMRLQQLEYIKNLMVEYYNQGHFIVLGGDWNSLFPGVTSDQFGSFKADPKNLEWLQVVPEAWAPEGWKWGYDSDVPTARLLDTPYRAGETFTCLIDGFLVSPNVNINSVKTHDLGFEFSDHNPVEIRVSAAGN